jgi:hypothetical protein
MYVEMEAMRDRPDLSMKTETKVFTKETKFIVAPCIGDPGLANNPLPLRSCFTTVKSAKPQSSNGRQMVIGNGH